MGDFSSMRANVGGAGVFGLAIALTLARRGARVVLADPAPEGLNASAVAAGMLAPALEAALDPLAHGHFLLLEEARDQWPAFVQDLAGVDLHRDGAIFSAPEPVLEHVLARLVAEGAVVEARDGALYTPEDWRLEPRATLQAMRRRFTDLGGEVVAGEVQTLEAADVTVLACGHQGLDLAPELSVLAPIRGQLLRFEAGPRGGPIRRSPDGYLAPGEGGAVVGATMEAGRTDLAVDPATSQHLRGVACALASELAGARFRAQVGVRAATPDGLPLVGPSARAGIWMAAGARRNGWLLAPLVATILADRLAGETKHTEATALLDSGRFRSTWGEEPIPPG
jgi:glycine oxidase